MQKAVKQKISLPTGGSAVVRARRASSHIQAKGLRLYFCYEELRFRYFHDKDTGEETRQPAQALCLLSERKEFQDEKARYPPETVRQPAGSASIHWSALPADSGKIGYGIYRSGTRCAGFSHSYTV